jgi:hypothetical protein
MAPKIKRICRNCGKEFWIRQCQLRNSNGKSCSNKCRIEHLNSKSANKRNVKRAHEIWNKHNPYDLIVIGDGYVIHHKDENPANDSPNNLQKMTKTDHNKYHNSGEKNGNFGKHPSKETLMKMSKGRKGILHSEETKRKMSESRRGKCKSEETKQRMRKPKSKEHRLKLLIALAKARKIRHELINGG